MSLGKPAKLFCVLLCFGIYTTGTLTGTHAFSGGPDPARTGAPGEWTCATGECHGSARSVDPQKFRIEAPATYEPGRTYKIIVRHVSADLTRRRWGFQITALAANGRAGTWQSLGAETQIVEDDFLRRQYAQHTFVGSFGGQTGGASWTVNWTAPLTNVGRVTFYAAGNQADDSRSSFGDLIFTAQAASEPGQTAPQPNPTASAPGSLLVFNLFTSPASNRARQDSRLNLTNTHESRAVTIRFLLVDGGNGALTDFFIRLAPLQTTGVLASDLDPGVTGYALATACDETTGCPISFNHLIGDEYVKLASGHAANLKAESFVLSPAATVACLNGVATLCFDGFDYNRAPRVPALSNLVSRAGGNDTLLAINRFGGDWRNGALPLNALSGLLHDDVEQSISVSLTAGNCQFLTSLSDQSFRTTPRFSEFIPAGRGGWLKLWAAEDTALLGAAINFNPQAGASAAFNQGHNLHHLSLAPSTTLLLPVRPPS